MSKWQLHKIQWQVFQTDTWYCKWDLQSLSELLTWLCNMYKLMISGKDKWMILWHYSKCTRLKIFTSISKQYGSNNQVYCRDGERQTDNFSDFLVLCNDEESIGANVYRKPTLTGRYWNFLLDSPRAQMKTVVRSLLRLADTHCSNKATLGKRRVPHCTWALSKW